jgi:FkbM family methyltransferase
MYVGLYLYGEYEARQSRLYRRLVRPGDVVVDAGANFGWYSVLFSEAVGAEGHVYAFEPVPFIADLARDTISLNDRFGVVTLAGAGLGEAPSSFTVFTFPGSPHGEASASTRGRPEAVPHDCTLTSLDVAVRENGIEHIDFMKVDVEGYERALFVGGRETLATDDAPLIAFEINDECLEYLGLTPALVEQSLLDVGYTDFFAVRKAVSKVSGLVAGEGDYLAAKPSHRQRLAESLSQA